jgi:hypothetical protein
VQAGSDPGLDSCQPSASSRPGFEPDVPLLETAYRDAYPEEIDDPLIE